LILTSVSGECQTAIGNSTSLQPPSIKGLELTARSARSCVAPTSGCSSGLAFVRQAKLGVSCRVQVPAREGLANHLYRVLHLSRRWKTPNESDEAYTGHSGGRKGDRTPSSLGQPREGDHADGDGVHAPEAKTQASTGQEAGGSVGVRRAWQAEREASRTWETPGVPGTREAHPITQRAADGPWGVGSPQRTRRAGEPSTRGRG